MTDYNAKFARVLHSVAINTDLACRFVSQEIHDMAVRFSQ